MKRYKLELYDEFLVDDIEIVMVPDENGKWVRWEDVMMFINKLKAEVELSVIHQLLDDYLENDLP